MEDIVGKDKRIASLYGESKTFRFFYAILFLTWHYGMPIMAFAAGITLLLALAVQSDLFAGHQALVGLTLAVLAFGASFWSSAKENPKQHEMTYQNCKMLEIIEKVVNNQINRKDD